MVQHELVKHSNLPMNCLSVFDHFVKLALKGLNKGKKKPNVWWRYIDEILTTYIDDIFFIWEHGEELLKAFISEIN